jgi:hypothetical protein
VAERATDDDARAAEARLFTRYLVGREAPPALVDRYVEACRRLLPAAPDPSDDAVLAFARRHPWSIGCLDAACGLVRPGGDFRSRILLMAAVLETTPDFADQFLPRQMGPLALVAYVGVAGTAAVLQALVGLVLHRGLARRAA